MNIDKIELILDKVEVIGVSAKKVMKDGKIDLADLPTAILLLSEVQGMIEAFNGAKEAFEQAKDIDPAEGLKLVEKLYSVGKAIEKA